MSRKLPAETGVIDYRERKRTSPARKRFNPAKSRLPVIFLIILLIYVAFSFGTRFNTLYTMQHNVKQIQEQVDELTQKNAELRRQLEMVKSDAYVEEVAREKLGLVKAGEVPVVPVPDPDIGD